MSLDTVLNLKTTCGNITIGSSQRELSLVSTEAWMIWIVVKRPRILKEWWLKSSTFQQMVIPTQACFPNTQTQLSCVYLKRRISLSSQQAFIHLLLSSSWWTISLRTTLLQWKAFCRRTRGTFLMQHFQIAFQNLISLIRPSTSWTRLLEKRWLREQCDHSVLVLAMLPALTLMALCWKKQKQSLRSKSFSKVHSRERWIRRLFRRRAPCGMSQS